MLAYVEFKNIAGEAVTLPRSLSKYREQPRAVLVNELHVRALFVLLISLLVISQSVVALSSSINYIGIQSCLSQLYMKLYTKLFSIRFHIFYSKTSIFIILFIRYTNVLFKYNGGLSVGIIHVVSCTDVPRYDGGISCSPIDNR